MQFERDGAEHAAGAIGPEGLARLAALLGPIPTRPGLRLVDRPDLARWLEEVGVTATASARLAANATPVRAILFDKSDDANWALGWHQDRTIAVRARADVAGFGPWSTKAGICHVEPPFALIERMATVRIHLDPVTADNAPLLVVPGSHQRGRLNDSAINAIGRNGPATACLAEIGDAWWYRTAIVHASARAAVKQRRRVLQVDYAAEALPDPLKWRGLG